MKAKVVSIIAKGIAVGMLLAAYIAIVFMGKVVSVPSVIALAAATAAMFGDVTLSIWMDKFITLFNKKPEEKAVDPKD
jgi:hypothetical protein